MKDINNLIDNLTYSETYAVRWLLDELIKSKGYEFTIDTLEASVSAAVSETHIKSALRKLAIAEAIKFKSLGKNKIHIWVTGKSTFHTLVKALGVR